MKILPLYTSTGQRDAERVNSWSGLLCPNWNLPPFQIQRAALSSTGLTTAVLVDCDGAETNIFAEIEQTTHEKTTYDFITYNGEPLDTYINYDVYYLKCSDGNTEWFSEWIDVQNIQPSVLTGWDTVTGWSIFQTAAGGSRPGVDIDTAVSVGAASADSNTFGVRTDEKFTITYDFATTSLGVSARIHDSSDAVISNTVVLQDGVNTADLTVTATDSAAYLYFAQGAGTTSIGIFSLRRKAGDYVHMEYTNTNDIQGEESIFYASGFTQQVYLDTSMTPPAHEMIETGEEKNGVFQAEKMVDKLVYSLVAYESWSLFRALRILPLHDDIEIIDRTGKVYNPQQGNVRVAVDWGTYDTGSLRIDWNELGDVWTSNMDNIV